MQRILRVLKEMSSTLFPHPVSATRIVLRLLIGTYFLSLAFMYTPLSWVFGLLVLEPARIVNNFEVWRLFSYAFIHDPTRPLQFIFNCIFFYAVGPDLEYELGQKRFCLLMALAALGGSVLACATYFMGFFHHIFMGFSAVSLGLLMVWGILFSKRDMYWFGFVPLNGQQTILATFGLEIVYALAANSVLSSADHFGGMLVGALWALWAPRPRKKDFYFRS